jgi:tRNA(adenine34) deaminase
MLTNDKPFMELALEQAKTAFNAGEVPVGAVLVCAQNGVISKAHNQTIAQCDPCAHAEILAIQAAAKVLGNHRLKDTTLYVSLEPCAMCAGAIVQARIPRVVYATRDWNAGAGGTVMNILNHPKLNHHVDIDEGIYQKESEALLKEFFNLRR